MIKLNQKLTLILDINDLESDLGESMASAAIEYQKPDGSTTASWAATLDATALTVTYTVPADTLDEAGTWKVIAVVTFDGGTVLPGEAHKFTVFSRFN